MDVFDAIVSRRSIRNYVEKPIEEEKLIKILQAARYAPSAKNRQNWKFVIVKDAKTKKLLVPACYDQSFIAEAAIVVAGIADPRFRWYKIDMGIAFEHIALEAIELGLGTCWIGAFDEQKVSKILGVPENLETVILMTVGYPKKIPEPTSRKDIAEIVCYESFY